MKRSLMVAIVTMLVTMPGRADLITYSFDDEGQGFGYRGGFTINTDRLGPPLGAGQHLTVDAIVESSFTYRQANVSIVGVSPNLAIDPTTGRVLTDGFLRTGSGNAPGLPPYQLFYATMQFDRRFDVVGFRSADILGAQLVGGEDTVNPLIHVLAFGHWDVTVRPVPAPAGLVLAGLGSLTLLRRFLPRQPCTEHS